MSQWVRGLLGGAVILFLGASASSVEASADPLSVFVSVLPLKSFVESVGGDRVQVSVMVGPGQSPATYEPTPKQMSQLAESRLYFRVGVPFENVWIDRLQSVNPQMMIIDLRKDLPLRTFEAGGAGASHAGHDHVEEHDHGSFDPHVWTSPPLAKMMAERIRDTLRELDAGNSALYDEGYRRFSAELDSLDADIRRELADLPSRRFMVFHPSWGYFAETYNLEQIPIEYEGKEPGAKMLARVIQIGKEEGIRVVFVQEQFNASIAETVARAIGAQVVKVDPLAPDYAANLKRTAAAFATAMR
ncbi:MAG: zinc ABC transporter substrate-binding protein [Candidatus Eisenbacteria bacterium]|uniref:Zinc ABC transporter substrate-binding protein n=1 Tax=Eiseniibacteriota bacterium TaxID=2212470 RepID=A0A948RY71_UNCEI|nr:zinc ABC transporter substrate-binding protein [Candidatus Eisenbacteria bacterium]MBU2693200.1 zinc ABC transporter substrate-binding protein [Candidatus Eisenbacteria bacterium]